MNSRNNKRLYPRIAFKGQLHYQVRGKHDYTNTVVEDISAGGVAFINGTYLAPATELNLEINLNNRLMRPIGKVVWTMPMAHADIYRTGVQFMEFDQLEKKQLSEFVGMRLEQTQGV